MSPRLAGVLFSLGLLSGCAGSETTSPRRQTHDALVQDVFIPMTVDFQARAAELQTSLERLCAEPDQGRLDAARRAWSDARGAWRRADILTFGPHTQTPWRLTHQIDFYPPRLDAADAVLASDVELSVQHVADQGASARGLPVVEYLLYGETPDGVLGALRDADAGARRCAYLVGLGADLQQQATALRSAWEDEFGPQMMFDPGVDGRYRNLNEAFGDVVNSLGFTVQALRDDKLGQPLGVKADGTPQPDLVESRFSDRSAQDALDTLAGVEATFTGRYGLTQAMGIEQLLVERGQPRHGVFERLMADSVASLRAIDGPLRLAVVDEPTTVERARVELRELLTFLQADLTSLLSVSVTFGTNDGD